MYYSAKFGVFCHIAIKNLSLNALCAVQKEDLQYVTECAADGKGNSQHFGGVQQQGRV